MNIDFKFVPRYIFDFRPGFIELLITLKSDSYRGLDVEKKMVIKFIDSA